MDAARPGSDTAKGLSPIGGPRVRSLLPAKGLSPIGGPRVRSLLPPAPRRQRTRYTTATLVGAATPPGRLAAAIAAAAETAQSADVAVDVLNLAETPIDICDGWPLDSYSEATRGAVARIAMAGAVLIGAPVYRASYPGILKNLLDITPVEALQNKPVGIVAMGGSPHHYLAVDFPRTKEDGREVLWRADSRTDVPTPYRSSSSDIRSHIDIPISELASLAVPFLRLRMDDEQVLRRMAEQFELGRLREATRARFERAMTFAKSGVSSRQ
jgi:hypothetical protein